MAYPEDPVEAALLHPPLSVEQEEVACLDLLEDRVAFPYRLEVEVGFPFRQFLEVVEAVTCHSSNLVVVEVEVASPFLPC